MNFPLNTPARIREIIETMFDLDDIGAFWFSDDYKRFTINVYIDGTTSAQTYIYNEDKQDYELVAYNGLRRAKSET